MQISVKDLRYSYGGVKKNNSEEHALNGVSLLIEEGDFFGIIGQTGSGKSTFVQHLNGLIKNEEKNGEIVVGGVDLKDKNTDLKALRSKVGMVFQYPEYQLFADTVFEDIAFGPRNMKLDEAEVKTRVEHAMKLVGLDVAHFSARSPFDLSGGERF